MILTAMAAEQNMAVAACKTDITGHLAGAVLLAGFGTKPIPGAVCDDGIQKSVAFATHSLQAVLNELLNTGCDDLEAVQVALNNQMNWVNKNIAWFGSHIGQGIYLAGTVCYIADDRYICLPFGGATVRHWSESALTALTNKATENADISYIYDALGCIRRANGIFCSGTLAEGEQIICMSQSPELNLIPAIMQDAAHASPEFVTTSVYAGLHTGTVPRAALVIARMPDRESREKASVADEE